jgi:hypothetical protein
MLVNFLFPRIIGYSVSRKATGSIFNYRSSYNHHCLEVANLMMISYMPRSRREYYFRMKGKNDNVLLVKCRARVYINANVNHTPSSHKRYSMLIFFSLRQPFNRFYQILDLVSLVTFFPLPTIHYTPLLSIQPHRTRSPRIHIF